MASSLQFTLSLSKGRTLVLPVLYLAILITFSIGCKSRRQRDKEFMHEQIEKLNEKLESLKKEEWVDKYTLYDSVAKKYGESYLEQYRSTISASIAHIADLKEQFTKYCGDKDGLAIPLDKEDSIDLTNKFFSGNGAGEGLYFQLLSVQKIMSGQNNDPQLNKEIGAMAGLSHAEGSKMFIKKYFVNVPPVAVMTILSKFVNDIDRLEKKILLQILKSAHVTPR